MVDPVSTVVGGAVAKSAGKKLFGPTLDAMGEDLAHIYKAWSKPRRKNVEAILAKGARRANDFPGDGTVNPRVAHTVFEDGSWVSDDVGQQYFAGLLLSSRADSDGADDGVFYAGMVAGMTSNQVRLHHAIYLHFAQHLPANYASTEVRFENAVWMPADDAASLVSIIEGDDPIHALGEALGALNQLGLLGTVGACSPAEFAEHGVTTAIDSVVAVVTDAGLRLFLRAYGIRTSDSNRVGEYDWAAIDPIGGVSTHAILSNWDQGFSRDPAGDAPLQG